MEYTYSNVDGKDLKIGGIGHYGKVVELGPFCWKEKISICPKTNCVIGDKVEFTDGGDYYSGKLMKITVSFLRNRVNPEEENRLCGIEYTVKAHGKNSYTSFIYPKGTLNLNYFDR